MLGTLQKPTGRTKDKTHTLTLILLGLLNRTHHKEANKIIILKTFFLSVCYFLGFRGLGGPFINDVTQVEGGGMIFCDGMYEDESETPIKHDRGGRGVNFGSKLCDVIYECSLVSSRA